MAGTATSEHSIEALREFVATRVGLPVTKVKADSDIDVDLKCTGPDFDFLMEVYQETFSVNMDAYRWYFHTVDESGCGALFYVPAYDQVQHLPVTPAKFLEFANKGYWDIAYPEHRIADHRYGRLVRVVIIIALLLVFLKSCLG